MQELKFGPSALSCFPKRCQDSSTLLSCRRKVVGMERVADSTPRKSGGLGLGLSICRSIIEAHNGQLLASPNVPRGAIYGFIQPDGATKDVFVHILAVERAGLSTLAEGTKVTFDIVDNRGKEAAENLRLK